MRKYSLTSETKEYLGVTLYRIKAEISFSNVTKGELGGYIEMEKNLSHDGDAWVYGDAEVFGNARVSGNAWVYGNAWVSGNSRVYGNTEVSGNAEVFGDARVSGNARVSGDAKFGEGNENKKQKLIRKADELIAEAERLNKQADSL